MFIALCLLLAAPFSEEAPGLVANGGFERLQGERPEQWDLFVAPFPEGLATASSAMPFARAMRDAHAGEYCIALTTAVPYPQEPYNNWSQNIFEPVAGKRLVLTAAVKTENADGAAVWVQCWRRQPMHVAHVANTALENPMVGTQDWQEVRLEFDVPALTDFLTVRCVLKGAGTAWFDDVQLAIAETAKAPEPVAEKPAVETPAATEAPAAAMPPPPPPLPAETLPLETESVAAAPAVPSEVVAIEAELARLQEANVLLAEALEAMKTDRTQVLQDLIALQLQILSLQEALPGAREKAAVPVDPEAIPPLVPLDYPEEAP